MKKSTNGVSNSHKLWLEFLSQQATPKRSMPPHSSRERPKSSRSINSYKSQEEYYDEVLMLKKSIVCLNGENDLLKSKLRHQELELKKKDKQMADFINNLDEQPGPKDSSMNSSISIMKLKQSVAQLKSNIKSKESEILDLKSDIKYTRLNETKVVEETYLQEIRSLQQILKIQQQHQEQQTAVQKPRSSPEVKRQFGIEDDVPAPKPQKRKIGPHKREQKKQQKEKLGSEQEKTANDTFTMLEAKSGTTQKAVVSEQPNQELERVKTVCNDLNQEKMSLKLELEELKLRCKQLQDKQEAQIRDKEILRKTVSIEERSPKDRRKSGYGSPRNIEATNTNSESEEILRSSVIAYFDRQKSLATGSSWTNGDQNEINSSVIGHNERQKRLRGEIGRTKDEEQEWAMTTTPIHSSVLGYLSRKKGMSV